MDPISRAERILSGEDLTPITRLEYFLKAAAEAGAGELVATSDGEGNVTLSIGGND